MRILALIAIALLIPLNLQALAQSGEIKIGYLRVPPPRGALSLVELPAENDGLAGAELAIADNNTTGRFLNQSFSLEEAMLEDEQDPTQAVAAMAEKGVAFILADLDPNALLKAADAGRD